MMADQVNHGSNIDDTEYKRRSALIEKSANHIKQVLLPDMLKGIQHHEPTMRMKTIESAMASIKRRSEERMKRKKDKEDMEGLDLSWEEYWGEGHVRLHDYGPFPNIDEMFNSLPDIGGIRILLYFPSDVEEVEKRLKDHKHIEFVRRIRKVRGTSRDIFNMQFLIKGLKTRKAPEDNAISEDIFPGYRGDHFHVKLPGDKFIIEIQVSTLVMDAWSNVEHDIIYKAEKPAGQERKAILDSFNGIVLVGENALRQLDNSTRRELEEKHKKEGEFANHIYDVGRWIAEYYKDTGRVLPEDFVTWRHLDKLFEFLKADKEHTAGELKKLVRATGGTHLDQDLPLFLLERSCSDQQAGILSLAQLRQQPFDPAEDIQLRLDRVMALRVVHCLNVATSLDIRKLFLDVMKRVVQDPGQSGRYQPSLLDFLDVLHPGQGQYDFRSKKKLRQFCQRFLDTERLDAAMETLKNSEEREDLFGKEALKDASQEVLVRLCRKIVDAGRIAFPTFECAEGIPDAYEQQIVVPRTLCVLVEDTEFTHWIPDLHHVARYWQNTINYPPTNSPNVKRDYQQHLTIRKALGVNPADVLGYNVTELIVDRPGNTRPSRVSWHDVHLKKPHYTWILRLNTKDRSVTEFRTDKQADRPRKHPGYFVSVQQSSPEDPKWHYTPIKPKWELVKFKQPALSEEPIISEFVRSNCEFEDFFNALLPPGSPIERTGESWKMKVKGMSFSIDSTENEFILAETKVDLVNAPPHRSTRRNSSATMRDSTPSEELSEASGPLPQESPEEVNLLPQDSPEANSPLSLKADSSLPQELAEANSPLLQDSPKADSSLSQDLPEEESSLPEESPEAVNSLTQELAKADDSPPQEPPKANNPSTETPQTDNPLV
jgi:ppGpp synthetase/RelA/SpoT-type nucleotidyltranferase